MKKQNQIYKEKYGFSSHFVEALQEIFLNDEDEIN